MKPLHGSSIRRISSETKHGTRCKGNRLQKKDVNYVNVVAKIVNYDRYQNLIRCNTPRRIDAESVIIVKTRYLSESPL